MKNGCGLVKSGRVPGKIEVRVLDPPLKSCDIMSCDLSPSPVYSWL